MSQTEIWYWNGVALNTAYWNVTTFGGTRMALPTLRGQDVEVPYRAGQRWRSKFPNSRTVTLLMWTAGIDQSTGQPSADQQLAFNNNLQQLRSMFWTRGALGSVQGQLKRQWYITQSGTPQLVTATAMGELAGSMEPTMTGRTRADFPVDILLADPYFYGASQQQAVTGTGTITNLGDGVCGEGWASPVNSYTIKITANCTVTNTTAGCSVTFADPGGTSFPVTLDVLKFTAIDNAGKNQIAGVSHSGARMWLPLLAGANSISVSAGTATFTWCPPYL